MSSKIISEKKTKSKYTRCDNCRQDILSEKMFLHEGFCHRNNIFCDHCEKVFLKTDYDEHLKDLRNSMKDSAKSTDIGETEEIQTIPVIRQTITTVVNPNTHYEYIEMPMTEEYKINNPIYISESGNVLSSQNSNEYILPYLGINANNKEYGINYGQYNYPTQNNFNLINNNTYRNVFDSQTSYINNNIDNNFEYLKTNLGVANDIQKINKIKKEPSDRQSKYSHH